MSRYRFVSVSVSTVVYGENRPRGATVLVYLAAVDTAGRVWTKAPGKQWALES